MARCLFVYILAGWDRQLYTGVTNRLSRRLAEHHASSKPSAYTNRHRIHRLVYVERAGPPRLAIAREKQIKSWSRAKKVALIESMNPDWTDLACVIPLDR